MFGLRSLLPRSVLCCSLLPALLAPVMAADPDTSTSDPPTAVRRPAENEIDFRRAKTLLEKQKRGERLTDDEAEYLQLARQARKQMQRTSDSPAPQTGGRTNIGLVPLTDMTSEARYKGRTGGLYGEGRNTPPESHQKLAGQAAQQIQPLNADGQPAADGRIVLLSIGMSNTTQEFAEFVRVVQQDSNVADTVTVVDGAQGGMDASDWVDPANRFRSERPGPWESLDQRLKRANLSPQQVQAVWIKQARRAPASLGGFPKHADALADDLAAIVRELKNRFPNLRLAYLSSRTYGGYAASDLNPEPYAYEGAFSVQSIIQDQVAGRRNLNADPQAGKVVAPVLLWGPYLWSDGEAGRKSDDLTYSREDFVADGTHPSSSGRRKVAEQLLTFSKPTQPPGLGL